MQVSSSKHVRKWHRYAFRVKELNAKDSKIVPVASRARTFDGAMWKVRLILRPDHASNFFQLALQYFDEILSFRSSLRVMHTRFDLVMDKKCLKDEMI